MTTPFQDLLPNRICDALSHQGYQPTGQLFQLNSYENRVYQVHLEGNVSPLIAKFYRPGRWKEETLVDEHKVLIALAEAEVPVVRPVSLAQSKGFPSLGFDGPYYYCLYPKFGGHEQAELSNENLRWLGRLLGRLHNITHSLNVKNRLHLTAETYGWRSLDSILDKPHAPESLRDSLEDVISQCLEKIEPLFTQDWKPFAVHGDCHFGNILWNKDGPTLVDFDDMVVAPAIQDIWMLFFGDEDEQREQKKNFFEGYEMFRSFDHASFILTEPLRTLRMIRHAAWIGERFEEEIFKRAFPYYAETRYWQDFLLSIKEQYSSLRSF